MTAADYIVLGGRTLLAMCRYDFREREFEVLCAVLANSFLIGRAEARIPDLPALVGRRRRSAEVRATLADLIRARVLLVERPVYRILPDTSGWSVRAREADADRGGDQTELPLPSERPLDGPLADESAARALRAASPAPIPSPGMGAPRSAEASDSSCPRAGNQPGSESLLPHGEISAVSGLKNSHDHRAENQPGPQPPGEFLARPGSPGLKISQARAENQPGRAENQPGHPLAKNQPGPVGTHDQPVGPGSQVSVADLVAELRLAVDANAPPSPLAKNQPEPSRARAGVLCSALAKHACSAKTEQGVQGGPGEFLARGGPGEFSARDDPASGAEGEWAAILTEVERVSGPKFRRYRAQWERLTREDPDYVRALLSDLRASMRTRTREEDKIANPGGYMSRIAREEGRWPARA